MLLPTMIASLIEFHLGRMKAEDEKEKPGRGQLVSGGGDFGFFGSDAEEQALEVFFVGAQLRKHGAA